MSAKKRYIKVDFLNTGSSIGRTGTGYYYRDTFKKALEEFEVVLVPTRYGYQLAVVKEADVKPEGFMPSDIKTVAERIKSTTISADLRDERRKAIEKKIDKKIKEMDKLKVYKNYAESDPEVQALVNQLEALQ